MALSCFFETFKGGEGGWLDITILMKTMLSAFELDLDWRLLICEFEKLWFENENMNQQPCDQRPTSDQTTKWTSGLVTSNLMTKQPN